MDTRNAIIETAEAHFMKYGIRSVTMDDIAREMAVSKKTLYQYFKNKDDLVEQVVTTHTEREKSKIKQIRKESESALDEMVRVAKVFCLDLENVSPSTVYDLEKYYGKLWAETLKAQEEFDVWFIKGNLKRGRKEGLYHKNYNDEMVAKIFHKATLVLLNEISEGSSSYSRKKMIKELHNYHIRSISTPQGWGDWEILAKTI